MSKGLGGLDQQQKITFKIINYYGTTLIKRKCYQ